MTRIDNPFPTAPRIPVELRDKLKLKSKSVSAF